MPRKRNRFSAPNDSDDSDDEIEHVKIRLISPLHNDRLQAENYTLRTTLAQLTHERDAAVGHALQTNNDLASRLALIEVQLRAKNALLLDMESRVGLMPGHYANEERHEFKQYIENFAGLLQRLSEGRTANEQYRRIEDDNSFLVQHSNALLTNLQTTLEAYEELQKAFKGLQQKPKQNENMTKSWHAAMTSQIYDGRAREPVSHVVLNLNLARPVNQEIPTEAQTSKTAEASNSIDHPQSVMSPESFPKSSDLQSTREIIAQPLQLERIQTNDSENSSVAIDEIQFMLHDLESESILEKIAARLELSLKQTCNEKMKVKMLETQFNQFMNRESQLEQSLQDALDSLEIARVRTDALQTELNDIRNCKVQLEQLLDETWKPTIVTLKKHVQEIEAELKMSRQGYQAELLIKEQCRIHLQHEVDEYEGKLEASCRRLEALEAEKQALEVDMFALQTQIDRFSSNEARSQMSPQGPTECSASLSQNQKLLTLQQRCIQLEMSQQDATSKHEAQSNTLRTIRTELSNSREEIKLLEGTCHRNFVIPSRESCNPEKRRSEL
ncbi:hypothetical protein F5051DRAFT_444594 [Lentinula edodes]|nr:hypothetical protein F5051DRAFT_444594 [Lentinula edodes]